MFITLFVYVLNVVLFFESLMTDATRFNARKNKKDGLEPVMASNILALPIQPINA